MSKYRPLPDPSTERERVKIEDLLDHLLELKITQGIHEAQTKRGPGRAIRVEIRDITTGEIHSDVLLFQKVLVSTLTPLPVGTEILAYLRLGVGTDGKTPPYLLIDASGDPEAVALAMGDGVTTEEAVNNLKDLLG